MKRYPGASFNLLFHMFYLFNWGGTNGGGAVPSLFFLKPIPWVGLIFLEIRNTITVGHTGSPIFLCRATLTLPGPGVALFCPKFDIKSGYDKIFLYS